MRKSSLYNFVRKLAADLCVPGAARDALTFLRLSGVEALLDRPSAYSDVAPGSLPLEFSFSQACEKELRLLVEPCLPGESILARTVMGLGAIHDVTAAFFSSEMAQQACDLTRNLLPDGEEIPHLNWRSSVWLAIRVAESHPALRFYVNAQFRDAGDRWLRIGRALSTSGLNESAEALGRIRGDVEEFVEPIGLSFDVRHSGLTPARLHCVTGEISPFWLLRLLAIAKQEKAIEDAADFMDLFGLLEHRGECPFLVSLGIGPDGVGSVKIDVDLPGLDRHNPDRQALRLTNAEARFGRIEGYRNVSWALQNSQPRYIGITIAQNVHYLNVYLPCSFRLQHPKHYPLSAAFEKARAFVQGQLESMGALLMDARSSSADARLVPSRWPDLYMTCLLIQEHSTALGLPPGALERARFYVRDAQDGSYWRYLPDLPCDLDDSAMAWLALQTATHEIDAHIPTKVMAMANPDGGFPTFIGGRVQHQLSHPAVTLNVTLALDRANTDWSFSRSDRYLGEWLQQPDFPACHWIGSRLFPVFLFARSTCLVKRLGAQARERLVSTIIRLHRADGAWGTSLPDGLDTALAIICLDLLGTGIPRSDDLRHFLLTLQLEDGGWGWSPLYSDGSGTWFGHRAITTALAIRALEILESGRQQVAKT
jgi:hypothetical protein